MVKYVSTYYLVTNIPSFSMGLRGIVKEIKKSSEKKRDIKLKGTGHKMLE